VTAAGGDPSGILGEFAQFLEWRQAQQAEAEGAGVDVPLFEKLADGTERSATLPMRQARRLLESWGWLTPEGADDGGSDAGAGNDGPAGTARQFFQGLAGGKAPSGPKPASGQRAPRSAAG
jgi:hypothetical protein